MRQTNLSYLLALTILVGANTTIGKEVTLDLLPAGGTSNVFDISLAFNGFPETDSTNGSGDVVADLDLSLVDQQAVINGLSLTGGELTFGDIAFNFGKGVLVVNGTGVGGTATSPGGSTVVNNGLFDATGHELTINQGVFAVSGVFMDELDLSTLPFSGPGVGDGNISLTEINRIGDEVTYDVDLLLPIGFTDTVLEVPNLVRLDVAVSGNIEARGQFSIVVPEPSTLLVALAGLLIVGVRWRRWS